MKLKQEFIDIARKIINKHGIENYKSFWCDMEMEIEDYFDNYNDLYETIDELYIYFISNAIDQTYEMGIETPSK